MSSVNTLREASTTLTGISTIFSSQTNVLSEMRESIESLHAMAEETDGAISAETAHQEEVIEYLEGYISRQAADEADTSAAEEAVEKVREAATHSQTTGVRLEEIKQTLDSLLQMLNEINQGLGESYVANGEAATMIGNLTR